MRREILNCKRKTIHQPNCRSHNHGSRNGKFILYLLSQIASLLVLSACVPDPLEVKNIPTLKPQIVVNTQILPGESLVVLLTKTIGALDASDDTNPEELLNQVIITDATVTLEGANGIDTLLYLGSGLYGGVALSLKENELYSLHVASESLGEVRAITSVKPQVLFDEIEAQLYFNGFDDTLAQVTYAINDPAGENHYMINVQHVSTESRYSTQILNPPAFTKLFEDTGFDGQRFKETFRAFPRDYSRGDTVAVFLSNISEDYYKFIQLRQDTRFSLVEFIGEPANYPSNIVGGRGFFNLYIPDVRFFILEE